MPVQGLDHINIRTSDLAGTIAFFRDVLGMQAAASPASASMDDGAWILDETGKAVIHLAGAKVVYPSDGEFPFRHSMGSGALHHVALKCSGFEETLARIKARGLKLYVNDMPQRQLRQIFVHDVNDIMLELNFSGDR